MSNTEGNYIYGIIAASERREFGAIGIGERGDVVYTLPYQNLAAIVSRSPLVKYAVTRDNSLAHARVLEKALEEGYTVLPVRFCTIAEQEGIIVERVLSARYLELLDLVRGMEGKVELGVRTRWTDLDAIFAEIVAEHSEIKAIKEALLSERNEQKQYAGKIKIGQLVQKALEEKKNREAEELLASLRPFSLAWKKNQLYGDMHVVNAAFLVAKEREKEFDCKIQELEEAYGARKKLKYVGPMAPYNFVEVVINL
ncbi:MAG TPA: GvpL/GvpF family gas vesicle protein [Ktedonobacteraceae bacterium]|nr:GvpL/GvpF family gas vesicle protein [Ktedonobacteraceae bacterium]